MARSLIHNVTRLANLNPFDQALVHSGAGQLAIRVIVGVVMVYHGAQKLFGWFGGGGIEGSAAFFESIGIPLPTLSVYMAGGTELLGGVALIVGFFARPAAVALMFTMLVAAFTAHGGAFGLMHNGMEYALTLAIVSFGLVILGPGRVSVDHALLSATQRSHETNATPAAVPA